jgi:D-alanine--poly(phosphoribitol) ligase subunit 1
VPFFRKKGVRSIESILSILKADCAYVPLDASSPAARIESILEATRAKHVLVTRASRAAFEALCPPRPGLMLVEIDADPQESDAPVDYRNLSIDIAYVLFTSGSTGRPKGVMISHQMITDYIDWCVETYQLSGDDVIANHAPLYFDNSTFDLYTAFKTGASLHLIHDDLNLIMSNIISWLRKREISCFFCVPSVLNILLRSGKLVAGSLPRLRHVIAAGEALPPDVVRQWMTLFPEILVTNMYGPTEITVDCTWHRVARTPAPGELHIPIGKARTNMEVFVEREDGVLSTTPGDEGELIVRGRSVAYGYLGEPEKTRAAFFQNPRHDFYHDPLYRTGDVARIAEDGAFIFLGRRDSQIKYMGNRIELGEVEAALLAVPGVVDGVVLFNDSPISEEKAIGALVCLAPGLDRQTVVATLKQRLPGYMVPHRIVEAEIDLPRTPNGKADRRAAFGLVFPGRSVE